MTIKKLSLVLAIFLVVITLSACGKKSGVEGLSQTMEEEKKTEEKNDAEKIKIEGVLAGRLVDQNGNFFHIFFNPLKSLLILNQTILVQFLR